MSLLDQSARALLDGFASSHPTPGGGSAAALSGALGAALVAMVCSLPKTRTGAPDERARLDAALGWTREAGERLRALVDEDTAAYDAVVAAHRLPKASDAEKSARRAAIGAALRHATEVPLRSAEACLVVLRAAEAAAAHGNPNALSDARTAAALAFAGLLGAAENVRINAGSLADAGGALVEKVGAFVEEGRSRVDALLGPNRPVSQAGRS
jgi:formiminotetrahydrofolate cyclodeaminase